MKRVRNLFQFAITDEIRRRLNELAKQDNSSKRRILRILVENAYRQLEAEHSSTKITNQ